MPPSRWEEETAFWSALTGWERTGSRMPQFDALRRPGGQPLRFLLQRLDEELPDHEVTAHVDLATSDRAAETERHEALGARVLDRHDWWTVLRGPAGTTYCITDRAPEPGMPPAPTTTKGPPRDDPSRRR